MFKEGDPLQDCCMLLTFHLKLINLLIFTMIMNPTYFVIRIRNLINGNIFMGREHFKGSIKDHHIEEGAL